MLWQVRPDEGVRRAGHNWNINVLLVSRNTNSAFHLNRSTIELLNVEHTHINVVLQKAK